MICKKCNNLINDDCVKCPYCGEILIKKDEGLISIEEESVDVINVSGLNLDNNEDLLDKTKTISIIDVEETLNIEPEIIDNKSEVLEKEFLEPVITNVIPNVIENTVLNVNSDVTNNENKEQPKKKVNILFSCILLLIVVLLIGGGSYVYVLSTNKNIMFKSIDTVTNKMGSLISTKPFNKVSNIDSNYLKTDLNVSFVTEGLGDFVNLNNTKFDAEIITNKSGDEVNIDSNIVDNNEKISISTILKDKKIYNLVKDVYNTYYYKNFINDFNIENTLNVNDYEYLIKIILKNINDNIDNKDFVTNKEKIKVLDNEKNAKKISYEITSKKVNEISVKVLENILNDEKSLNILVKCSGKDIDSFKKLINYELINLKKDNIEDKVHLFYNVFVTGINNIVKYELIIDEKENNNKTVITIENEKNEYRLKVDANSKTVFILDFNNMENGKIDFTGNMDALLLKGSLLNNDKTNKLHVEIGTTEIENGVAFEINTKEDVSNNNLKYKVSASIFIKSGLLLNEKDMKFAINIDTNTIGVQEMPLVNLDKSLEHNNISLEETEKLKNKIIELPVVKSFSSMFGGMINKEDENNDFFTNNNESFYYTTNVNRVK